MEDFISNNNDAISFRTIVLEHLRSILRLTGTSGSNYVTSYGRTVSSLSDVLLPFYDETMKTDYKSYEDEKNKVDGHNAFEIVSMHRKLFRALNGLLSRSDYLQASIYSEEDEA